MLSSEVSLSESLSEGVDSEPESDGVDSLDGEPSETELSLTSDDWWLDEDHESSTVEYDGLPDSLGGSDDAESEGVDSESESDSESLDGDPSDTELSLLSDGLPEDGDPLELESVTVE
ncbi:hypothetical protein LF1_06790 [Rubripirellula obstinata]|uniref:Uncharacterized protein n=1 Tax=Rubripirellula obstinata TaxID=406547 RepID=A0A5B1CFY2_9BACT|nr:hypothetical protein [Rubripirellula obstinata]KAA1258164.1 hypothetical protein LF1_06790 [Rubripirellula obstinata]